MVSRKKGVETLFQSLRYPETEQDLLFSSSFPNEAVTAGDYEQLQERRCKAKCSCVSPKRLCKVLVKFNK